MDGFIGEIKCFGGNYAPLNWMFCWGQILPIQQYTPLFALIGNQFGGDGKVNFALPDLRGRIPITSGVIQGYTPKYQGQFGGYENVLLNISQIPPHNHNIVNTSTCEKNLSINATANVKCSSSIIDSNTPKNNYLGTFERGTNLYSTSVNADTMNTNLLSNVNFNIQGDISVNVNSTCGASGDSLAHSNIQPSQCLNFIICIYGYWPPRD
ncbi:MAG: hypothetical protein A2W95_14840 [Bacteroidetes bacterium GWA2_40_14]|jgi:microcystin-dependent protein|nr:MAG: hypothetical protein A2W95_14840 [Bacteroidetes bacterium GWA2_40_14]